MNAAVTRGICSHCGRVMRITKAGVLGHHVDQSAPTNMPWRPRCAGAGQRPVEVESDPTCVCDHLRSEHAPVADKDECWHGLDSGSFCACPTFRFAQVQS